MTSVVRPEFPWLETVYRMCERNKNRAAIDTVFDKVERLLYDSEFASCDALLRLVDIHRINRSVVISILSITWAARNFLPYRNKFVEEVEYMLTWQVGKERAERLLAGLR